MKDKVLEIFMMRGFKTSKLIKMWMISIKLKIKWKSSNKDKHNIGKEFNKLTFYVKAFENQSNQVTVIHKIVLRVKDMRDFNKKSHLPGKHLMIHLSVLLFLTNIDTNHLKVLFKTRKSGILTLILLILRTKNILIHNWIVEIKDNHLHIHQTENKENIILYKRLTLQKLIKFNLSNVYLQNLETFNFLNNNFRSINKKIKFNQIFKIIFKQPHNIIYPTMKLPKF